MARLTIQSLIALILVLGVACGGSSKKHSSLPGADIAFQQAKSCDILGQNQATFLLFDDQTDGWKACNQERATERFTPASTYKVVHALIALQEKAIKDENEIVPWDQVDRGMPEWNQNTTLRMGMKYSTVWFYQLMAKRIGHARMRHWVDQMKYGNQRIGTGESLQRFWLDGPLEISAYEQIEILKSLRAFDLPFEPEHQKTVIDITKVVEGEGWRFHAKTGALMNFAKVDTDAGEANREKTTGWYIGWVEEIDGTPVFFAFNMKMRDKDDLAKRQALTLKLLEANGISTDIIKKVRDSL